MKQFLKKLKLIEDFSTVIKMERGAFYAKFKSCVDEGGTGFFSSVFDVFSRSKNEFKGHVASDVFRIKKRSRLFDMNASLAVAYGTYRQEGESLIIEAEINGFKGIMIPFYIFLVVFYAIFITSFVFVDQMPGWEAALIFPFIIFHATFMFGIPYFVMRRSVSKMKHELEREFYYMTK